MIFNKNIRFSLLISLLFWALLSTDVFANRLVQDHNQYHADDLWDRVRSRFALKLPHASKAIHKIETSLTRNPKSINQIIARSEKYLFYIVEEVDRRNIPMEVALIPVIESAYNPLIKADSSSAGLWQFIPETARILGLEQNVWHDDRRDIIASTEAALDYLQYLHQRFNDWMVAIAAYNIGEGAVSRALSKNMHKGRSTSFHDLNLPVEAKHYVYKLLAVKDIIANSKKYGIKLRPVPNRPYFDTIKIHEHIDISLVTHLANISEVEFTALNPAYNRYVIKVLDTPRTLLLPKNKKDIFLRNLETYQDPRISWHIYEIKKDENIREIAARHSTTVKQLQTINGISRNKNLTLGQKILVPQALREDQIAATAQTEYNLTNQQVKFHIVKKGDTLYEIAKRYGTTVDQIKSWNNSHDKHLFIGQKLILMRS